MTLDILKYHISSFISKIIQFYVEARTMRAGLSTTEILFGRNEEQVFNPNEQRKVSKNAF